VTGICLAALCIAGGALGAVGHRCGLGTALEVPRRLLLRPWRIPRAELPPVFERKNGEEIPSLWLRTDGTIVGVAIYVFAISATVALICLLFGVSFR
jgi:hypothetical protein